MPCCRPGVQSAEGFRKRALEGARVIQHLLEFASAQSLQALPELFQVHGPPAAFCQTFPATSKGLDCCMLRLQLGLPFLDV